MIEPLTTRAVRAAAVPIPRARERMIIAKMVIRILHHHHRAHFTGRVGRSLDLTAVRLAVLIGHIEGHPLTVTKIAGTIDLSRATVLRKLAQLQKQGLIRCEQRGSRNTYVLEPKRVGTAETDARILHEVKQAALALSQLGIAGGLLIDAYVGDLYAIEAWGLIVL
jgi:predicted transcriptional regulator